MFGFSPCLLFVVVVFLSKRGLRLLLLFFSHLLSHHLVSVSFLLPLSICLLCSVSSETRGIQETESETQGTVDEHHKLPFCLVPGSEFLG